MPPKIFRAPDGREWMVVSDGADHQVYLQDREGAERRVVGHFAEDEGVESGQKVAIYFDFALDAEGSLEVEKRRDWMLLGATAAKGLQYERQRSHTLIRWNGTAFVPGSPRIVHERVFGSGERRWIVRSDPAVTPDSTTAVIKHHVWLEDADGEREVATFRDGAVTGGEPPITTLTHTSFELAGDGNLTAVRSKESVDVDGIVMTSRFVWNGQEFVLESE